MRDFRQLQVWQKGHQLTLAVYKVTASFPQDELYGLRSQMRRSSASIPTNIAEGCGRSGVPELTRFLEIASGSASELEYQLLLAHDLSYFATPTHTTLEEQTQEVKRMLTSFVTKLKTDR